jgi:hypothetical protein
MDRGRIRTQEEASMWEILWMTKGMVRVLTRVSFFSPIFFWEIPNFLRGQFLKEKKSGKRRLHVLVLCFVCVSHKNLQISYIYIHAYTYIYHTYIYIYISSVVVCTKFCVLVCEWCVCMCIIFYRFLRGMLE